MSSAAAQSAAPLTNKMASAPGPVVSLTATVAPAAPAPVAPPLTYVPGMEPNPLCEALPVFRLDALLRPTGAGPLGADAQRLCAAAAECMCSTSALVVRDPRVDSAQNEAFLSLMERYFAQPAEDKMADVRPELSYQVGATPGGVERPRCLSDPALLSTTNSLGAADRPTVPTQADAKWRFFWRVGERPTAADTCYPELNAEPVVPAAFPEWAAVLDAWGGKMLAAVETAAEMLARGLGLEPDALTRRMRRGPHLLAPTGSDLGGATARGAVLAGWHYDLNLLTIHGRSQYPGLFAWLRGGHRVPVLIPDGCLLIQAGKQMEYLTGGAVPAGFHEVVCTEEALEAARRALSEGRPPWRVSSTVFSHVASDELLHPLGAFATPQALAAYPPTPAGEQVQRELEAINLRRLSS